MAKITPQKAKSDADASAPHTIDAPSKSKPFDPVAKTRNALKAAKQRCTNPNNPDYPNYGGSGIKYLLPSLKEVIAAIGLPKAADMQLDRIDPHGHYELANVRWAHKNVQAINKKKFVPKNADLQAFAAARKAATLQRKTIQRMWGVAIRHRNFAPISDADRAFIKSYDGMTPNLHLSLGPTGNDIFELVSLTCPGHTVRIQGCRYYSGSDNRLLSSDAICNGVIRTLGMLEAHYNVSNEEKMAVAAAYHNSSAGLVWHGVTLGASPTAPPIDGHMLALASRLFIIKNGQGALYPCVSVLDQLKEGGSHWKSELEGTPLLSAHALFIPDFQLDHGEAWQLEPMQINQLWSLLKYRQDAGLKTFIGVQEIKRLPRMLGAYLLNEFDSLHVGTFPSPQHPAPTPYIPPPKVSEPVFQGEQDCPYIKVKKPD